MSNTKKYTIVLKYYKEVWEERNPEKIPDLFAQDFVNHAGSRGNLAGPEGLKKNYESLINAFPDVRFELDDIIEENDKVVLRYTMYGTHQGDFMGLKATGQSVTVPGIGIYRIADNQIKEGWVLRDSLTLYKQLGITSI